MVPGNKKFKPDSLFSTTSKRFCNCDVFNTEELLDIVREWLTCIEMKSKNVRKWKLRLQKKFHNFIEITSSNCYHLQGVQNNLPIFDAFVAGVRLWVKHSIFDQDSQSIKAGTVAEKLLLKKHMEADCDLLLKEIVSAAYITSWKTPLSGQKLNHIRQLYEWYNPRNRKIKQVSDLKSVSIPSSAQLKASSHDTTLEMKALKVATESSLLLASARAHFVTSRYQNPGLVSLKVLNKSHL